MEETPKKSDSQNNNQSSSLTNDNERLTDQELGNKKGKTKDDNMNTHTIDKAITVNELAMRAVTSSVQKWGNSLAVRIPKDMAENKAFDQGTEVEIIETNDGLKIVLKKKKAEYKLADLLSQCKPENRHETIDFGVAGKEMI